MITIENAANFGIEKKGVLGQTIELLTHKQKPFLDVLAAISKDSTMNGWEYVSKHPDTGRQEALPVGKISPYGEKNLFTGAGLCPIATLALFDGVSALGLPHLSLGIQRMGIYFNKESRMGGLKYHELYGEHALVHLSDTKSNQHVYVDPTYGQVRWPWAGKFLMTQDISKFYNTNGSYPLDGKRPLHPSDLINTTESNADELKFQLNSKGIPEIEYKRLVATLSGGHT